MRGSLGSAGRVQPPLAGSREGSRPCAPQRSTVGFAACPALPTALLDVSGVRFTLASFLSTDRMSAVSASQIGKWGPKVDTSSV